jgi:hypothetical protein
MPRMVMIEEISEEENQRRYDVAMEHIRNMKPPKFIEWWRVENTGFTESSWFDISQSSTNPTRFSTQDKAIEYIVNSKERNYPTRWRYVHVTLEREDNKSITTEVWTEL